MKAGQPASKKVVPITVFLVPILVLGGLVVIIALHSGLSQAEQKRLDRAEIEKYERYFQGDARALSSRSEKKPVDVASLERAGASKCDEGLVLIQSILQANALDDRGKSALKADLLKGKNLLEEGFDLLQRADGGCYDMTKYMAALKTARLKLAELQD